MTGQGVRSPLAALIGLALASTAVGAQGAPAASPMSAADSVALRLVERAAVAYASARTLQATFQQTLMNPRTGTEYRASGEFLQRGTTHFAFRFSDPVGDRIVADAAALWLYLPSNAPGQALKLSRAAGAGLDIASEVLRDPATRYRVRAVSPAELDGHPTQGIELVPRVGGGAFTKATLWIDPAQALVRRAIITEATGMQRTILFTAIRVGAALPADAFVFTPPEGVRVIDQAALFGGSAPPRSP
ncbi:MAG: outer membrane lipoprotein carrier protein LolA [Gemmatimonadaceae bacterium]